ncbi:glycosyltransferase family 4 protein [Nitratifractor sp.]|uniref:glycosyltransferase family 4 protein n=1 Tax=Nitratifractor sp. TaxID=2268144 RepID=UPI0025D63485|nr:glycosyltransferase family 4 protein [Nitratifractor sp.]
MKIAFLSHLDLNLYRFRLPVMKELLRRGHRVYAVCPKGEHADRFTAEGVEVVHYPILRQSLNPLKELRTLRSLAEILRDLDPDIVHAFTHKPNIYGALCAPRHRIQTVTGLGSFFIDEGKKSLLVRRLIEGLYRWTARKSDRVIFQNSDDMRYFLNRAIVREEQARLVRSSGIDTEHFRPMEAPKELHRIAGIDGEPKPVVLMIARVIRDKGVREYLEAAQRLKDQAHFLYIGESDPGNKGAFHPDWGVVKPLGFRENVREWIALSDLVVLPSYREGVPRTLLEAAAMGKALVATDVPGCREVVRPEGNGLLVPAGDAEVLAEAMGELLADDAKRERLANESRRIAVDEFDVRRVVEAYLSIYEELVQ